MLALLALPPAVLLALGRLTLAWPLPPALAVLVAAQAAMYWLVNRITNGLLWREARAVLRLA